MLMVWRVELGASQRGSWIAECLVSPGVGATAEGGAASAISGSFGAEEI